MNKFMKNLMTEEEFNSVNSMDREVLERQADVYKEDFNWRYACRYCNLTEDTLRKFADRVDWFEVSANCKFLPTKFIESFKTKLDWRELSQHYPFSKSMLIQYVDYIDWDCAPTFQKSVDEEVIDTVLASSKKDELNWHSVAVLIKLSEKALEKYADYITKAQKWDIVSYYQDLSEKFILKYADKLNWNYISQKQHLSREFMVKHFDKINPTWAKQYQKNWDEDIEKEYNFFKTMNNPNFLTELKAVFTKYGYDYNIFNALKNTLE